MISELIGLLCMCKITIVTYFESFGVKHIPKKIKAFINRPLSSALQNKTLKQVFSEYRHMIQ